ncbi:Integrase core domain-containing protein [Rhizobium tibeticum]|uniref:Integrase core domain-containing protein n=1 Tax=Rhizobium tibeticum TaxID=501024 RepID=A0A1H8X464_9HYPH|nr:Transposase [Rhizobium tibeticum]SEP34715.1 Integrase core domain-containing protein [Rhizobium tibeticum]
MAGEKLFVDYAGDTVTVVVDRLSGKTRQAHLFVAVLGVSSLSFAHACWSETLPDWIECHLLALEAFGGAPALLVPDNAKVAVIKPAYLIRRSIVPMPGWQRITQALFFRRDRESLGTRQKSKLRFALSSAGCLAGYATASFTALPM